MYSSPSPSLEALCANRLVYIAKFITLIITFFISAAAFCQQVEVNLTRGNAQVTLPIGSINAGDLSVPIGITYQSGMKVNEGQGNAGMGWSLYAGGMIMREVRGLPDDYVGSVSSASDNRKGWLHGKYARWPRNFTPTGNDDYDVCTDEFNDWKSIDSLGYKQDPEPDMFFISAPGLRGQFVFNNYRVIKTIPYMDVRIDITRDADSLINQIIITDNLGKKYTFEAGDKVTRQAYIMESFDSWSIPYSSLFHFTKPATFYRSWYLVEIASPSGCEITFGYDHTQEGYEPSFMPKVRIGYDATDTSSVIVDLARTRKITTISGANATASFGWNGSLLNSVVMTENSYNTFERYNFQYAHIASTSVASKEKREFLIGFYKDVDCNVFPGYRFEYHGINLSTKETDVPFGTTLKQDMFGYYNGAATSLVPTLYTKSGELNAEQSRLSDAPGYYGYGTTNRAVDTSKVYFGSIKKLIYPTGAYDLVRYESASYYDDLTDASVNGGGPRVRSIKTSTGDAAANIMRTYRYLLASGKSSGRWTYRPVFVYNISGTNYPVPENQAPESLLLYSRVDVLTTGRGRSIFEFRNKGMYPQLSQADYRVSRSRIVRFTIGACPYVYSTAPDYKYYGTPNAPNTNYDFERELPVKRSDFDIDGKLVSKKLYTYQRTTVQPDTIVALRFLRQSNYGGYDNIIYSKYTLLSNVSTTVLLERTKLYDQISSDTTKATETSSKYVLNPAQLLAQVKSIASNGDSLYRFYKYAKDYPGTGSDTQSTMINGLVSANRHATVIETASKRGSVYTGGSLTLFNNTFGGSRILPSQQLSLGNPSGFSLSTVTGSAFVYSGNYFPVQTIGSYDNKGNVLVSTDRSRSVQSVILGHNKTLPSLAISNARYDQVIFTDFEPNLASGVSYTGTLSSDAWSGRKSLSLTSANSVTQTGVSKGASYYRVSCWVKGASNATISVSINGGAASTMSYTTSGWKYLERRIDLTAASSTFSFSLTTSATVLIDNITFYPETADVVAHAYDPRDGKTADLDSRGNASFQEFDEWGRPHFGKNVDKDIVTVRDYGYKTPGVLLPNTAFTHTTPLDEITVGSSVLFNITDACYSPVSYHWYVDNVEVSTSNSLYYAFNANKDYYVRLDAEAAGLTNSRVMLVHPLPRISVVLDVNGANTHFTCQDFSAVITTTAVVTGSYTSAETKYEWFYIKNGVRTDLAFTSSNVIAFNMDMGANNLLYCTVHAKMKNESTGNYDPLPLVTSPHQFFEWIREPPCPNGW